MRPCPSSKSLPTRRPYSRPRKRCTLRRFIVYWGMAEICHPLFQTLSPAFGPPGRIEPPDGSASYVSIHHDFAGGDRGTGQAAGRCPAGRLPHRVYRRSRRRQRRIPEQGQRPTAGQIPAPAAGPQDLTPEKEPPAPAPTGPPIRVRAQAGLRTAARLTQAEERPIRALETARPPAPEMEAAMLPQKRLRMTALSS